MDNLEKILNTRKGNTTLRCHTMPMINRGEYTVGLHSGAMAQLALILFPTKCTKELLQACLFHDSAFEYITGDVNGYAKRIWPELDNVLTSIEVDLNSQHNLMPELISTETSIWKFLDGLELWMYGIEQMALGNRDRHLKLMVAHHKEKIINWSYSEGPKYTTVNLHDFMNDFEKEVLGE